MLSIRGTIRLTQRHYSAIDELIAHDGVVMNIGCLCGSCQDQMYRITVLPGMNMTTSSSSAEEFEAGTFTKMHQEL